MPRKQTEKWCEDLWVDIDFKIDIDRKYYAESETNSFYDPQDPDDGYVVRGISPVYDKIENQKYDFY